MCQEIKEMHPRHMISQFHDFTNKLLWAEWFNVENGWCSRHKCLASPWETLATFMFRFCAWDVIDIWVVVKKWHGTSKHVGTHLFTTGYLHLVFRCLNRAGGNVLNLYCSCSGKREIPERKTKHLQLSSQYPEFTQMFFDAAMKTRLI